jgi:hypothetical protein
MTQDEQEDFDERAGILEFCAGFEREEAERLAKKMTGRRDSIKKIDTITDK